MPTGGSGPRRPSLFGDVRRLGEVDSTNRVAADLARAGTPPGVVLVADHQTAGRGRRGRSWQAPPGSSLMVSVALTPPPGDPAAALATVAAALAAAGACADVAGVRPGLKWPNDLVVAERKLGGVLCELVPAAGGGAVVVIGVGINLRWPAGPPAGLEHSAVAAEAVARAPVDRDALLDAYLHHLNGRWHDLATGEGRRRVLDELRRHCVTLGRAVRVELPGGRILDGVATAVDVDGALVVAAGGAHHRVTAGDVIHVR